MKEMTETMKLELNEFTYLVILKIYLKYQMVDKAVEVYKETLEKKVKIKALYKLLYKYDISNEYNRMQAAMYDEETMKQFRERIAPPRNA